MFTFYFHVSRWPQSALSFVYFHTICNLPPFGIVDYDDLTYGDISSIIRTKCENKDRTLTNTIICNDPASTSKPNIQAPQVVVPEAKSTRPKKEAIVNDLQKEIKETRSEVQTLRENLATLRFDENQRLTYLENTLHHGNEKRTSLQIPSDEEDETDNLVTNMVQRKFLETINRINFQK